MLTYSLEKDGGESLYTQLYACIRRDILSGTLSPRQKLPSKRALAQHLEVSVITVKNAYEQLAAEGYIYTVEKKGYYVSPLESPLPPAAPPPLVPERPAEPVFLDLATGSLDRSYFPFTVWSRLMRQTILEEDTELLRSTPYNGAPALRRAIAAHLRQFRAMDVDPEQIIIGAGTELLYTLIIQLLGRDKRYAVEDPGYGKIAKIYQAHQVPLCRVGLDGGGLDITLLRRQPADVVHISPSHHYPTGIVMPITRRQELLRWAAEQPERYILEDDYDSEFRFVGRPIPTLFSVSENQRVIYLNTFSKTIAPSIRISYMILPPRLLDAWEEKMGFYSCTVPAFEQLTLTRFLDGGYFERHVSRMKKHYKARLQGLRALLAQPETARLCTARQAVAGLHFLLEFHTKERGQSLRAALGDAGLSAPLLSEFYLRKSPAEAERCAVVQYSGLTEADFAESLQKLSQRLTPEA